MRRIKYFVAVSLDGYIAGPDNEIDWLFTDQDYGLSAFLKTVDTVLIGRKTYEMMQKLGSDSYTGKQNYVFSRKKKTNERENVHWIDEDPEVFVPKLREKPGADIWVVGGGLLFGYLLDRNLIDEIILAVHPIILGEGIPFVDQIRKKHNLKLKKIRSYQTGLVILVYNLNK
jgi:dihydrofolate reductase